MHWSLASRSRLRMLRNMYGASSLSHSIRTGRPRTSLLAASASSCEYAASTACSAVSEAGRSFSERVMLIVGHWSLVIGHWSFDAADLLATGAARARTVRIGHTLIA